jgi:hypothetical protein
MNPSVSFRRILTLVGGVAAMLVPKPSLAQSPVQYQNGPVISEPIIYPIYYGTGWTSAAIQAQQNYLTNLTNFMSGVGVPTGQSPYLRQYGVVAGFVAGATHITSISGLTKTLNDSNIRTIIHTGQSKYGVAAYGPDILIMVFPDATYTTAPGGAAYHASEATSKYYGVVYSAYINNAPFTLGDISSHEIFEASTDPDGPSGGVFGWSNQTVTGNPEICDDQQCQPANGTAQIITANGIQFLGCADNTNGGKCTATPYITNPGAPSCGAILPGQGLVGGSPQNAVQSCNGLYTLGLTQESLLFMDSHGNVLWSSPAAAPGTPLETSVVQGDGNWVINRGWSGDDTFWASNTFGHPGNYLAIQDDGNLVLYTSTGNPIWIYGSPKAPSSCGHFQSGEGLAEGDSMLSCDGRFTLTMQSDGNLVIYFRGGALWSSGTSGSGNLVVALMQPDGNFVLYNRATNPETAIWATGTNPGNGNYLYLRNDGNMLIENQQGTALWQTNTGGH